MNKTQRRPSASIIVPHPYPCESAGEDERKLSKFCRRKPATHWNQQLEQLPELEKNTISIGIYMHFSFQSLITKDILLFLSIIVK